MQPAAPDMTIGLLFGLMSSVLWWMFIVMVIGVVASVVTPLVLSANESTYRVGFFGLTIFEMRYEEGVRMKVRIFCKKSDDEAKELIKWLKTKGHITGDEKEILEEYTQKK